MIEAHMNETAYNVLRSHAAWMDLTGRGNIRATGEDRARLLHAMCTNHVQQLTPGTGCYAFFLSAQGRILADVNVYCLPDYLLLDTEPETKIKVQEHLDKYIIADDVNLNDFTDSTAVISVEGPAADDVVTSLGAPAAQLPHTIAQWEHGLVARASYTGAPGYMFMVPSEQRSDLVARLGAGGVPEARTAEAEVVRLEHGRPRFGVDFSDANIPQETQLGHAIHPSKGCYLGQEIVERVRSRGHVNRVLVLLEMNTDQAPASGVKVRAGDDDVGDVRSSAYSPGLAQSIAFALVRAEALQRPLSVDGIAARVRKSS
jgi:aminomethyltransferase